MALNPHIALAARKAALDNMLSGANNGTLVIYNGSQPANADTAVGVQTALATFALGATAFAASTGSSGATVTAALNSVSAVTASATGTASWFRIFKSDGVTAVADGSAGTSGCDMNLNSAAISSGGSVSITSGSYTFSA